MRHAVDALDVKQGFLIDDNLDVLLSSLDEQERRLIRLDTIFKALTVQTEDDMKSLATYFIDTDKVNITVNYLM